MLIQKWVWTHSLHLHFATTASFIHEYANADVDVKVWTGLCVSVGPQFLHASAKDLKSLHLFTFNLL